MEEMNLKDLEAIMKLMGKYQIDLVELPGIKVSKKIHLGPKVPKPKYSAAPPINMQTEEDIMFMSSAAPKLSLDDFAKFTANPIKDIE